MPRSNVELENRGLRAYCREYRSNECTSSRDQILQTFFIAWNKDNLYRKARACYFKSTLHFLAATTYFWIASNWQLQQKSHQAQVVPFRPTVSSQAMLRIPWVALASPWSRGPEKYPLINLVTLLGVCWVIWDGDYGFGRSSARDKHPDF